jgi:hypothetical protein
MKKKIALATRLATGAAIAASALGVIASSAGAASPTMHMSFPAAGLPFACFSGTLTATGGTIDEVNHESVDAQGVYHFTGTVTPHDVTLEDGSGNVYTLSGASWFGGRATDPSLTTVIAAGDTEHFVIHDAQGGVYAKVQMVGHFNQNGGYFSFNRGTCLPPV